MGREWAQYSIFAVLTILFFGFFYQWFGNPKSRNLDKLSRFRNKLFGLQKEFFLLNQKKTVHDDKVAVFLSSLKVPKGRGVTAKRVTWNLDKKEGEFQELLSIENFLLLCRQRILELIKELETLNNKPFRASVKKYLSFQDDEDQWSKSLVNLKEEAESLKDNQNLLKHSFLAFQEESRKRLLGFKKSS